VNGSPGLRLAQQTGAGFSTVDGTETVLFPWPSEAQPQAASSFLFREPVVEPPAEATAAAQPSASAAAPAAAPTPPPQPPSAQPIDEIYEQVVGRLRRDLLAERERMGDLLGDLP
jgi:hypothetical protein